MRENAKREKPDLLCNFIEITLQHWCSPVNLQYIFRTPFPKNTSGRLNLIQNTPKYIKKETFFIQIQILVTFNMLPWSFITNNPANIYLLKVNNRSTRKSYEICSKLTKKNPERRQ